jgi:hypothetical protein
VATETHPRPDTAASKRGKRLEPVVLSMYEDEHGAVVRDIPQITSPEYPFMFANLDARRADDGRCGFQCIAATCYDLIAARLPI